MEEEWEMMGGRGEGGRGDRKNTEGLVRKFDLTF
jgi:hypothetical protein